MEPRSPQAATSATDGTFTVRQKMSAGTWTVRLRGGQLESVPELVLQPDQTVATLDVVVTPLDEIDAVEGVVVDQLGHPVTRASIRISPSAGGKGWIHTTDKVGHFRVERRPQDPTEPVTVRATREGYEVATSESPVEWGTDDIRLVMTKGLELVVRVTDEATGKPIEDYGIRVKPKPGTTQTRFSRDERIRNRGRHEDGLTTITGLKRGTHWLWVEVSHNEWVQEGHVEFEMTDTTAPRVDVALARATECRLRLVDADGNPIEGARVQLLEPLDGPEITLATFANPLDGRASTSRSDQALTLIDTHTDINGEVTLRAHGRLACGLRILGPGAKPFAKSPVRLDNIPDPRVLECAEGATIDVRIGPSRLVDQIWQEAGVDPASIDEERDRRFMPTVYLRQEQARFPPGYLERVPLDSKGRVRLSGVPPGDWTLVLITKRADRSEDKVQVATVLGLRDGQDARLEWKRAMVSIGSVVVDGPSAEAIELHIPASAGY